jgi:hypothetical protein
LDKKGLIGIDSHLTCLSLLLQHGIGSDQPEHLIPITRKVLQGQFILATRDHTETSTSEETVQTRGDVLRFQMESLVPDLPK